MAIGTNPILDNNYAPTLNKIHLFVKRKTQIPLLPYPCTLLSYPFSLYTSPMQSFAILGANPDFSLAEIEAVTGQTPTWNTAQAAIFDDVAWNLPALQNTLGGVQKLGVILGSIGKDETFDGVVDMLALDLTSDHLAGSRLNIGCSLYAPNAKGSHLIQSLHRLGMTLKKKAIDAGFSARVVSSKDAALSSVVVKKNNLLMSGAEYVFLVHKDLIWIGKTETAQDVDDWAARDVGKPFRNAKQGMLPPKLARMMINLAGIQPPFTVLDPFCGSGTVLMEALLLGADKVVGSDINPRAIHDTQENLKWLQSRYPFLSLKPFALNPSSAVDASSHIPPHSINLLVTEPFLGIPRQGTESDAAVRIAVAELETLYEKSFSALKQTLTPHARVVIASPIHFTKTETLAPNTVEIMISLGYTYLPFKTPLKYHREGQYVGREILRFTLNKN